MRIRSATRLILVAALTACAAALAAAPRPGEDDLALQPGHEVEGRRVASR